MKTLMFYINSLNQGGAERVLLQLAERFAAAGYRAVFVTSFRSADEYPVPAGVERISMEQENLPQSRLKKNISRISTLRKLCREYKPEALIAFMAEPNFRAVLAGAGLPVKIIISVRNTPEKEYAGRLFGFVAKYILPMADGCVFQTEDARDYFPKKLRDKSAVIMNQVSRSFFDEAPAPVKKDIYTVGRLNSQKNQAMLIRAFARLEGCKDRLIIYGEGPLRAELESLIKSLGLEERVKLMGLSANIPADIKSAKIFVLPSDYEGMPNALLEAMALGLCCIATDCPCGGPRAVIEDGISGRLIPVGDEAALADALQALLADEGTRNAMAKAAGARAEMFSPEAIFRQWQDYVEKIISHTGL